MHKLDQLEATLRASKKQNDGRDDQNKLLSLQNWKRRIFYWDLKPEGYEQFWEDPNSLKETQHFPLPFHVGVARQNGDTILPTLNLAYGFILQHLKKSNFSLREAKRLVVVKLPNIQKSLMKVFLSEHLNEHAINRITDQYIEFATMDDATNALKLNGMEIGNEKIEFKRPDAYVPPTKEDLLLPDHVEESENKLVITNIPLNLNEEQIKELLSTAGTLKAFELEKGPHGHHKGHCYCEYENSNITEIAIANLNGMEISNSRLGVQRALFGSKSTYCPAKMLPNGIPQGYPDFSKLFSKLECPKSKILCCYNLLDDSDVVNEDTIKRVRKDVMYELQDFKPISIEIPKPNTWIDPDNPSSVLEKIGAPKIFVEFKDEVDAEKAGNHLQGKMYEERMVLCTWFPEQFWKAKNFHPLEKEE
eukprot:NODE_721_length_4486_cov_1.005015.p2 type:complete len:419 gc:universal NODE_721_length_4486_cov_1.005015:1015-2271(+)